MGGVRTGVTEEEIAGFKRGVAASCALGHVPGEEEMFEALQGVVVREETCCVYWRGGLPCCLKESSEKGEVSTQLCSL